MTCRVLAPKGRIVNVSLPVELEQFVQRLVERGDFANPSEAISAGLKLLHAKLEREVMTHEVLQARESYATSGGIDAEVVLAEILQKQRDRGSRQ